MEVLPSLTDGRFKVLHQVRLVAHDGVEADIRECPPEGGEVVAVDEVDGLVPLRQGLDLLALAPLARLLEGAYLEDLEREAALARELVELADHVLDVHLGGCHVEDPVGLARLQPLGEDARRDSRFPHTDIRRRQVAEPACVGLQGWQDAVVELLVGDDLAVVGLPDEPPLRLVVEHREFRARKRARLDDQARVGV